MVKTCRLLLTIIDKSPTLQYQIELCASGNISTSENQHTVQFALSALLSHQKRWRQLRLRWRGSIPFSRNAAYEFSGGVFGQLVPPFRHGLTFATMPAATTDGALDAIETVCSHLNMGFPPRDFAMDPLQDLLVVVQEGERRSVVGLHYLNDKNR